MTKREVVQLHKHILMLWDNSVNMAAGFYPRYNGIVPTDPVKLSTIQKIATTRKILITGVSTAGTITITLMYE